MVISLPSKKKRLSSPVSCEGRVGDYKEISVQHEMPIYCLPSFTIISGNHFHSSLSQQTYTATVSLTLSPSSVFGSTAMEGNRARKLNFNAPLLSTRRPGSYLEEQATSCSASHHSSSRVPFSWEQAPGKPKDPGTGSDEAAAFTPRPKPPPGRSWRRHPTNHEDDEDESGKDILSLTEAIDIVEKAEQVEASSDTASSNLDRLTLQSVGELNGDGASTQSPNFMMERFLPDAAALAAATSALNLSKGLDQNPETRSVAGSVSSTKACGLEMVLPWRMRQRLAGVNSLGHHPTSNAKHKRRFSSLFLPSADWSCKY